MYRLPSTVARINQFIASEKKKGTNWESNPYRNEIFFRDITGSNSSYHQNLPRGSAPHLFIIYSTDGSLDEVFYRLAPSRGILILYRDPVWSEPIIKQAPEHIQRIVSRVRQYWR